MELHLLRDVPEHHGKHERVTRLHLRDRRFGRKFFAVLAQAGDLSALSHLAGALRRVPESLDVLRVDRPEALGQQHVQGLPHDFVGGPAEDLLGAVIEQRDLLLGIDADDRVGRDGDDVGEKELGEAAGFRFAG